MATTQTTTPSQDVLTMLEDKAAQLRIDSIRSTTAAGSGHPTTCASAADFMSALFFSVMRYDPKNPRNPHNDAFVLSKGHAAPILYAAWAEAGLFPREDLLQLRKFDSDLEGHPTPRLPFVDVATGSLGQGVCAAVGIALNAKYLDKSDQRVYVVLGDGETAEGSVWEAAHAASFHKLNNLCATVDVNRLGQSQPTMDQHDMEAHRARWAAFGWNAIVVDGHDMAALLEAYAEAERTKDRPTVLLARTLKGKGIPGIEDKNGHHGKALDKKQAEEAIASLQKSIRGGGAKWTPRLPSDAAPAIPNTPDPKAQFPAPPYVAGKDEVMTRKAFGTALAELGKVDPRVVALDGDVENSTYTEDFQKACPERFFEMYIAEQNMVGAAMGLSAHGRIPFASTFSCFVSRAYDFIRMAAIGDNNIKVVGTHAGVSIGEDGPSQMGLEDLAMMTAQPNITVLYPSDGVSTWVAVKLAADVKGPVYVRTGRPKNPVIYKTDEKFEIGKSKVLRQSDSDKLTIVAAGVTLFEALKAHDQLKSEGINTRVVDLFSVQPIDRDGLIAAARATGGRVLTVEDHYASGGVGDAVLSALEDQRVMVDKLAVRKIPHSGTPDELLEKYGISASHIVEAARKLAKA
ncbi:MAG TPA: transketolase [Bryobacteraceae bacterium]|nr:transketolase [Bryobacteraceae bacterium]